MNKIFCNRCGKELTDDYYTIDIYGHEVNPSNDGRANVDVTAINIATNILKTIKQERRFCKNCMVDIDRYAVHGNETKYNLEGGIKTSNDTIKEEFIKFFNDLRKKGKSD